MYGNISITELFSRLHFLENHTRCQSDELAKKQQKIDEQTEEIKVLKEELNRLTEFLKLAGKKIYGSSTERMSEDYGQLSFYEDDEEQIVSSAQTKVSTYTRKKRCTLEEKMKNSPKTVVFHKLTDEEKYAGNEVYKGTLKITLKLQQYEEKNYGYEIESVKRRATCSNKKSV